MTPASTVIIGIGHPYRSDDAVGLNVLTLLAAGGRLAADGRDLDLVPATGEPIDLIDAWTGRETAVIIDALHHPHARAGRIHRITVDVTGQDELPVLTPVSGHGVELGATLALAAALDRLPRHLVVYAIEVDTVHFGDVLSEPVAVAAQQAADRIAGEFGSSSPQSRPESATFGR